MLSKVLMFPFLTDNSGRVKTSNGPPPVSTGPNPSAPGCNFPFSGSSFMQTPYIQAPQYDTHHSPYHPELEEEDDEDGEEVDENCEQEPESVEQNQLEEDLDLNASDARDFPGQDHDSNVAISSGFEELAATTNIAQ